MMKSACIPYREAVLSKSRTCVSIADEVQTSLERELSIDDVSSLRCISRLNTELKLDAAALDALSDEEKTQLPLLGVPVVLKENMMTRNMATSGGVLALKDFPQTSTGRDATVVRLLKEKGALIVGKCWMPDFADYMSGTMPSSYCGALQGQIKHPLSLSAESDQTFEYCRGGGSSTGVACAVAGHLHKRFDIPLGIGSETQNSLQAPACNSGLVAIKPTVGLVSRHGIMPLAISQDTAGPMARSVYDCCLALNAFVSGGADLKGDSLTLTSMGHVEKDYTEFCVRADASKSTMTGNLAAERSEPLTVGIPRDWSLWKEKEAYKEHCEVIENVLNELKLGSSLKFVDNLSIPTADEVSDLGSSVFRTEFREALNVFLQEFGGVHEQIKSMADVLEFNASHPHAIPHGQNLLEAAEKTRGLASEVYQEDRKRDITLCREKGIDFCFKQHPMVDVLLAPMDRAAKLLGKAGYPAISVPCGRTKNGACVGITFFGTAWSESTLITVASLFEQEVEQINREL